MPAYSRPSRFNTVIPSEIVERVKQLVLVSNHIVITCHVSPDGDALGSSTGLCAVMRALGKDVRIVTADCPPRSLCFLPGVRDIVSATRQPELAARLLGEADLLFCMDFNSLKRVDRLAELVEVSGAKRVVIDHHINPDIEADTIISFPQVSSTSALLYILLYQAGWARYLSRGAAADIFTGMMTDTGHFSYNSNDPDLYLIIHDLLRKGIDKDNLYKLVMNTSSENRVRIMGYGQYRMEVIKPHRLGLITLSREELAEFDYSKGDTEGLVNTPLAIPEVTWSVFMREDEKDKVKVSMRSKDTFPVNLVCEECFGGGGHENAAGGEFQGSLSEATSYLLTILPKYDKYL
ncbi:MAG: DHH family phosphoesterase [Duncaniella sp.]|nr:DHH family phosphoesterase [Duncaniella sp.]